MLRLLPSEPTVAQPLSKLVAIARTASRRFEHPTLDVMGLLHGFEALADTPNALTGLAQGPQEQKGRERGGAVTKDCACPWAGGNRAEQSAAHRRPRFQSSRRA